MGKATRTTGTKPQDHTDTPLQDQDTSIKATTGTTTETTMTVEGVDQPIEEVAKEEEIDLAIGGMAEEVNLDIGTMAIEEDLQW